MYAIQAEHITKQYNNGVQALQGLSLSVKQGEIFTLLGQNGAGKSTLINILTTYIKPTSGTVIMLDKNISNKRIDIRSEIACVSQQCSIDTYLSLEENMMFQSRLYRISKKEAKQRTETLINDFNLARYRKHPVSSYSGGIKRRLDIALNMMSNPKILFLDEPTVGMDIQSRMHMWEMMKKVRDDFGTTIFLTTHYLEEADHLSDTICIMKEGKAVLQGSPHELRSYLQQTSVQIPFTSKQDAIRYSETIKQQVAPYTVIVNENTIVIYSNEPYATMEKLGTYLFEQHISILGIEIVQPTLEDVFLRLTSNQKQEVM